MKETPIVDLMPLITPGSKGDDEKRSRNRERVRAFEGLVDSEKRSPTGEL
jgi:hypothetical protein